MSRSLLLPSLTLSLALASLGAAQDVGSPAPEEIDLEDFAQTGAESWEDLEGRAVLIEFFAHW